MWSVAVHATARVRQLAREQAAGYPTARASKASWSQNWPCASYQILRVAHAPGMPGTFSPSPRVSDSDMHHCTCVTHVSWCMPGSLISGFRWSRWRGKRSRCSQRMRNLQIYVSGKRPIVRCWLECLVLVYTVLRVRHVVERHDFRYLRPHRCPCGKK